MLLGLVAGCLLLALPWREFPDPRFAGSVLMAGAGVLLAWLGLLRSVLSAPDGDGGSQAVTGLPGGCRVTGSRRVARWLLPLSGGAMLGFGWSALHHERALDARLALAPGAEPARFEAVVVSDPEPVADLAGHGRAIRFHARIVGSRESSGSPRGGAVVRLTWRDAAVLAVGETWRFTASIKGPWGYANPSGVDFERWMLGRRLQGSGYVRSAERVGPVWASPISALRARLNGLVSRLPLSHPGVVQALLTGSKGSVSSEQWELFRRTGTVHLMVVSGLHVGLAATAGYLAGQGFARLAGLMLPVLLLWMNARRIAAFTGAACCTAYLLLSGAGVPAQRAWLMALPALFLLAWGRRLRVGGTLLVAGAALLAADPLRIHLQGFWLSFGAVGLLMLAFGGRYQAVSWPRALLRSQWVIGIGLAPLLVGLTHVVSPTAVLANLLAVPVVSFLVVPLVLLGGVLISCQPALAETVLNLADGSIELVLRWLGLLAGISLVHLPGDLVVLTIAQAAAVWLTLGRPARGGLLLWLAALLWLSGRSAGLSAPQGDLPGRPVALPPGAFRVLALDVGQGTAVLVDTVKHRLLFDAGPAYPGGFETGSSVVVPNLVASGPAVLDVLVLSHDDLDHVGGAPYVRHTVPIRAVLSSYPARGARGCHGRSWEWDGVVFRFLRPERPADASDNELSCVLLVSAGEQSLLLAGDIGAAVERSLVRLLRGPVSLMFAPHHGSGASSTPALVRVARPRMVFVSAALGNRYGHPHPDVVRRYGTIGAQMHQTGRHGALLWRSDRPADVVRWRSQRSPYWRTQEKGLAPLWGPSRR